MKLEDISIHGWIQEHQIKTEKGDPLTFKDHLYLFEPYSDLSPLQAIQKAAQIGASNKDNLKAFWVAKKLHLDIIYTLPTDSDVEDFVGHKTNRLIAQNPILKEYTKDHDNIYQKSVGDSIIHFRGTFAKKSATMVPSDLNIHDEVDFSDTTIIQDYESRQQHSKYKWRWYFGHPDLGEDSGINRYFLLSDQKHWFHKCSRCNEWQYLSWPNSINQELGIYQCLKCKLELREEDRRKGKWVAKYRGREISGYWMPLLLAPWVTARSIVDKWDDKKVTEQFFFNRILGLPYVGGGNKLTHSLLMKNLTTNNLYPDKSERVVIGVDTGKYAHYVCGTEKGLFYYDSIQDYDYKELEDLLKRWPRAIAVIDQGGDLTGPRKLREKYPGRVYLCTYGEDRKTQELVRWGKKDEDGAVTVDRNRMIQNVVDTFSDGRLPIMGEENDWHEYYLHWNNLTRVKEETDDGKVKKIWKRSGDDHWAHATVYCLTGLSRFASSGKIVSGSAKLKPNSYNIAPDSTVKVDLSKIIPMGVVPEEDEWR